MGMTKEVQEEYENNKFNFKDWDRSVLEEYLLELEKKKWIIDHKEYRVTDPYEKISELENSNKTSLNPEAMGFFPTYRMYQNAREVYYNAKTTR